MTSITVDGTTTLLGNAAYAPFGPSTGWTWGNSQVMTRAYDLDGRVRSLTLGPSTASYADLSQVFGYDSLNRLLSANLAAGQTQGFTYDANSNRLTKTVNSSTTTSTFPTTSHKLSSLSGGTTRNFTYDNAGNVTASAGITYVYDGRGRMKQAGATTYLVNGLGQRVKKSTASVDTFFAYDEAGRLLGEYDSSGGPVQEMVWLGEIPVGVIKPKTGGFDLFYIWADHLGTPRLISDTTNVARWEWAHNDPFGNNAPNENPAGAGAFAFNLRFPGQYYDAETGLHYNYFRDYDASLGRYVQSDPIGLKGGLNTYSYAGGQPLTVADPTGLLGVKPTKSDVLLCILNPTSCGTAIVCGFKAFNEADKEYPQLTGHNDSKDAFRHCFWSCCMTKLMGPSKAWSAGASHERQPSQPACERNMDLFNNAVGVGLGASGGDCSSCKHQPLQRQPVGSCQPCGYSAYGY